MYLETFLLAEAATAAPDGKLYVHGGGMTRVVAPGFPFMLQLALVVRLLVDESDVEQRHVFNVSIIDPSGVSIVPTPPVIWEGGAGVAEALPDGEQRYMQLVFTLGVLFGGPGIHVVSFAADDEKLRSMTLPVLTIPEPAQPNRAERRRRDRER